MIAALLALTAARAQDTSRHVAWSAFVDAYYAWDTGRPRTMDRPFTTQAARHNEFNVNLAHAGVSLVSDRVRGRVALQAGTSVQANYAGEPRIGALSGADLSRHIQEATAGYRIARGLWADAGIYFSYIGWEGWISRDNPTYTRSLVADYTPYYLSGVKLTWQPAPAWTVQVHVMNGWQNISENNSGKAVGGRLDWQATPALTLGYANFIGNELPDSVPARTRVFQQVLGKLALAGGVMLQGQFDYGTQGGSNWYGWVMIGRKQVRPALAVVGRIEQYHDPDQVIVTTGTANPLRATGGSLGLDVGRVDGMLWRTEIRGLAADARLFPSDGAANASKHGVLIVSSLALSL